MLGIRIVVCSVFSNRNEELTCVVISLGFMLFLDLAMVTSILGSFERGFGSFARGLSLSGLCES